jgi:hypothetical protein
MAMRSMDKTKVTENYDIGCLEAIISEGRKYFNDKDKRGLSSAIEQEMRVLTDAMKKDNVRANKELRSRIGKELSELRNAQAKLFK